MVTAGQLEKAVKVRLEAQHVEVTDVSGGCGQAFVVTVVSPLFEGKNRLARHRLVNQGLAEEIASIHAFTQKNFTPSEWEARLSDTDK